MESFKLEKTFQITKANNQTSTMTCQKKILFAGISFTTFNTLCNTDVGWHKNATQDYQRTLF